MASVVRYIRNETGVARLSENVWLVNTGESMTALGHLVAFAAHEEVAYGILPFRDAPQWLPGDFDPKTIQGRNG